MDGGQELHFVILDEKDKDPQQKITHILIDPLSIDFLWDVGKDPYGGVPYIMAPISCIKRLIEEIERGKEGTVSCQESNDPMNYLGANISGQRVELNYVRDGVTKVEILSKSSLFKIKKALHTQLE